MTVEQKQVPGFTIHSSDPIITDGQSVTLSGVLDQPGSATPEPSTSVTLYGRIGDLFPLLCIVTVLGVLIGRTLDHSR